VKYSPSRAREAQVSACGTMDSHLFVFTFGFLLLRRRSQDPRSLKSGNNLSKISHACLAWSISRLDAWKKREGGCCGEDTGSEWRDRPAPCSAEWPRGSGQAVNRPGCWGEDTDSVPISDTSDVQEQEWTCARLGRVRARTGELAVLFFEE